MMEAGVLIGKDGEPICWHLPRDRSGGSLPDSPDLWSVIWENRSNVLGFAHSHPGSGTPGPSYEDVTTFAAVESALGRRLLWWIASSDDSALVRWAGPGRLQYSVDDDPGAHSWIAKLREYSRYDR
jgi:hypothetical protein